MKRLLILLALVAILAPQAEACGKRKAKRAARRAACVQTMSIQSCGVSSTFQSFMLVRPR